MPKLEFVNRSLNLVEATMLNTLYPHIIDLVKRTGMDFVVIGGVSLSAYVAPRHTDDLDLIMDKSDYEKLEPELIELIGEKPIFKDATMVRYKKALDVIFPVLNLFKQTLRYKKARTIFEKQVFVPEVEALIVLKYHAYKFGGKERARIIRKSDKLDIEKLSNNVIDKNKLKKYADTVETGRTFNEILNLAKEESFEFKWK